jgi:hypothetical protein
VRRRYGIYRHAGRPDEAVKIGFSWPALCLGVLWMFAKRLPGYALAWTGCIVVLAALLVVTSQMPPDGLTVALYCVLAALAVGIFVVPALRGNTWQESRLLRRGYVFVGEVSAPTAKVALAAGTPAAQLRRSER